MKYAVRSRTRAFLSVAGAAALCAFAMGSANAQSFSAWDSNEARLVSGYSFSINGAAQTDLSNVGQSGTYEFGFASPGAPIVVQFLGGSSRFGVAPGGFMSFMSIDQFGLISATDFSVGLGGDTIHDYNGANDVAWNTATMGGGGGYKSANFGSADILKAGSEYTGPGNAQYGSFQFDVAGPASGIFMGIHFRNGNGVTAPVLIGGIDPGISSSEALTVTPEPSSLALFAGGSFPFAGLFWLRLRSRKKAA